MQAYKLAELRGLEVIHNSSNNEKTGKLRVVHKKLNNGMEIDTKSPRNKIKEEVRLKSNLLDKEDKEAVKELLGFDFDIAIRQDELDRGISNEYIDFIEQGDKVIKEFTDGDITVEDVNHRDSFLSHLDEREACMRRCLQLIGDSKHPKAQEMRLRWQRLLITRQAVKSVTGDKKVSDKPVDKEYANSVWGKALSKMKEKTLNPFLKARLEMEIEQLKREEENYFASKSVEAKSKAKSSKKEIMQKRKARIAELSGRQNRFSKTSETNSKVIQLNDRMQANGFDLARINRMREERTL